ncbi:tRNA (adenosine(37)-N6)-threonylcarbamoyltransferase complex dimerization subunit type 1 TsaB [Agaribacterium haliotis]|uniref:tRNA (adenosine(37)-N6)-threonylcarbamoyltransferase complex dimerization subunit type 1 TsaB n=1 Tax=Agaribacterium haliotis TaxID=2013869 RepID=UPI000BB53BCA|nr:tRNA (adenosine(37)-N6)-threonylcarbamoyltransferase complex dimerization subunit type 1 TsaB [Agaribacterium haliotis]
MDQTLLAIDSSSQGCSVALNYRGQRIALASDEPRSHARSLLPLIDQLLSQAGIELQQLDAIALVHGPGSFTGIRIALSVAQGLAYGANLPLIGVSSLRCLAERALPLASEPCTLVCAIDARMQELYWAAFHFDGKQIKPAGSEGVMGYAEFNHALRQFDTELVGVGSGFKLDELELERFHCFHQNIEPSAEAVLEVLSKEASLDKLKVAADKLEPLYLRNEVAWQKRQRIRSEAPLL